MKISFNDITVQIFALSMFAFDIAFMKILKIKGSQKIFKTFPMELSELGLLSPT
jgi:hypothetical protein